MFEHIRVRFKWETRGLGAIGLVLGCRLWKGHHGRLETTIELLEGLGLSDNRWEKGRKKKKGEEEDKEVDWGRKEEAGEERIRRESKLLFCFEPSG